MQVTVLMWLVWEDAVTNWVLCVLIIDVSRVKQVLLLAIIGWWWCGICHSDGDRFDDCPLLATTSEVLKTGVRDQADCLEFNIKIILLMIGNDGGGDNDV